MHIIYNRRYSTYAYIYKHCFLVSIIIILKHRLVIKLPSHIVAVIQAELIF